MLKPQELIGIGVAICLAAGFVSFLMWSAGKTLGIPRGRLRGSVLTVWGSVVACAAGLVVARLCLGAGLVESAGMGGIETRELDSTGKLAVVAGVAWAVVWLLVALRAASAVTGAAASGQLPEAGTDEPPADQEE